MLRVGAVIFDDIENPSHGWSCVAGDEYARRIKQPSDLRTDVVWLVNLNTNQCYIFTMSNNAFIRPSTFLPVKFSDLCAETGLDASNNINGEAIEPNVVVKMLAQMFERLVRIKCAFLNIPRENWRPPAFDFKKTLREELFRHDQKCKPELIEAVKEARQEWVTCQMRFYDKEQEYRRFYLPRLAHSKDMLSIPVPSENDYQVIPKNKLPKGRQQFGEWASNIDGLVLANAVIHEIDESVSSVINYGAIARQETSVKGDKVKTYTCTRQWFTTHDLIALSGNASISIKDAIVFDNKICKPPSQIPQIASFLDSITLAEEISYSMGVFSHGLWTSLLAANPRPIFKDISVNVWTPFIRSYDRFKCMLMASEVAKAGYTLAGYGSGKIHAWLPKESPADVLTVSDKSKSYPGMFIANEANSHNAVAFESDETPWGINMQMISSGMVDDFMSIDDDLVNSWISRHPVTN